MVYPLSMSSLPELSSDRYPNRFRAHGGIIPSGYIHPALKGTRALITHTNPETWVSDYGDALYSYALMRVRNTSISEDPVKETFLSATNARENFAGK